MTDGDDWQESFLQIKLYNRKHKKKCFSKVMDFNVILMK